MDLWPGLVPASTKTQISGYSMNGSQAKLEWITLKCTHVQLLANGVEEPAVGVDLLLVLRLDDEDDLDGDQVGAIILLLREDELGLSIDRELSGVLDLVYG